MQTYEVGRLSALSDGVFAVAATLLVLEIKLPDPPLPEKELIHELIDNIPALFGWLVSFVVLGRFWTVHHHVTNTLARCSTTTIVWNFIFLATISLLPFGASLVGTYEFEAAGPFVVFSLSLGLAAFTLGLFTQHVARAGHLREEKEHDLDQVWKRHGLVVPLVAAIAAATSFLHPAVALTVLLAESALVLMMQLRATTANRG
jgi:uncharacterized membrane protein